MIRYQLAEVCSWARRMLGVALGFFSRCTSNPLKVVYCALVRQLLEFSVEGMPYRQLSEAEMAAVLELQTLESKRPVHVCSSRFGVCMTALTCWSCGCPLLQGPRRFLSWTHSSCLAMNSAIIACIQKLGNLVSRRVDFLQWQYLNPSHAKC